MSISRLSTNYAFVRSMSNVSTAFQNLVELQEQLTTGKRINRPSDDPAGMQQVFRINSSITENEQYIKNIDRSVGRLNAASTVLQQVEDVLVEMRDLALNAGAVTTTSAERTAYANEVDLMLEHLVNLVNSRHQGKFIFGGLNTISGSLPLSAPYNFVYDSSNIVSGVVANPRGINNLFFIDVSEGVRDTINISGSAPFQPNGYQGSGDVFDVLINLRVALQNNDATAIETAQDDLESAILQVTQEDTSVGAKMNKMEITRDALEATVLDDKEQKSAVEDIDYANLMIKYSTAETLLNSTLSATATVLQNSLLNFI